MSGISPTFVQVIETVDHILIAFGRLCAQRGFGLAEAIDLADATWTRSGTRMVAALEDSYQALCMRYGVAPTGDEDWAGLVHNLCPEALRGRL